MNVSFTLLAFLYFAPFPMLMRAYPGEVRNIIKQARQSGIRTRYIPPLAASLAAAMIIAWPLTVLIVAGVAPDDN